MQNLIVILFIVVPIFSYAKTDVLFVSPAQMTSLEAKFNSATTPGDAINNTAWNCRLYGKRSLTYKKRPVVLYKLKKLADNTFKNSGSHVTKSYEKTPKGLVAVRSTLTDTVRMTKDNMIISRLTLKTGDIVSYSLCRN